MGWASASPLVTEGAWRCLWIRCVIRNVWEALDANLPGSTSITIHCTADPSALAYPPPSRLPHHTQWARTRMSHCPHRAVPSFSSGLVRQTQAMGPSGQNQRGGKGSQASFHLCFLMRSSEHSFPASLWGNNSGTANNDQGGCFKVKTWKSITLQTGRAEALRHISPGIWNRIQLISTQDVPNLHGRWTRKIPGFKAGINRTFRGVEKKTAWNVLLADDKKMKCVESKSILRNRLEEKSHCKSWNYNNKSAHTKPSILFWSPFQTCFF